jgi:hypothetical protein
VNVDDDRGLILVGLRRHAPAWRLIVSSIALVAALSRRLDGIVIAVWNSDG